MTAPPPPLASAPLRVVSEIGSGAIARVLRVVDEGTGIEYAAKVLHERHRRDEAARRRFVREAELSRTLVHDNLVRVYDALPLNGHSALVMELVEGPTLADLIAQHELLPLEQWVPLALGIARGLAHAHAAGVIHRDLKPANILLMPDGHSWVPKIGDFGMARASSFASADKGALTVLGTPQYMAPECLDPLAVDARTDVYALGCIVHEMITGAPPFGGATPFAVLDQHRNASPPSLPESIPDPLGALVRQLLAKAAGDRPQSASAVAMALSQWVGPSGALVSEPATNALALRAEHAADGDCASCGAAVLAEARVCFRCGLVQAVYERGDYSLFVTGPGKVSYKLDTALRDRLLRWLSANRALGIAAAALEGTIPRLPFLLIGRISRNCAETLRASLLHIGIEAVWERGGRLSHFGILRNTNKQAGRVLAICFAVLGAPALIYPAIAMATLPLLLLCLPVVYGTMLYRVSRPLAAHTAVAPRSLPPAVQQRLASLARVVPQIEERRHRDALRAVVHRVIELCGDLPAEHHQQIGAEMEHAVGLAAGAAARMDWLDRRMTDPSFDPADTEARALMHERDLWSGRLLDLTAALDSLAARRAAALARPTGAALDEELDALHATVEALEEVEAG